MTETALKVLYIMGWGRSGSTLLDNLLGTPDGWFSTGELHYFWERSVLGGRSCGCGERVTDCEVWSRVLAEMDGEDAGRITRSQNDAVRIRHTWTLLRASPAQLVDRPSLQGYADVAARLYAAVGHVTGARVIVDSSKRPSDAALLELLPGVQAFFVQLVRDPRAVAYSWQRKKRQRDPAAPAEMVPHGTVDSGINWTFWNLAAESVRRRAGRSRSMLLRYEDLVQNPRAAIDSIARLLGEPDAGFPFEDERTVRLKPNHTVSGNPSRFTTGSVRIQPDDEWRSRLPATDRWMTTALTLPLLHRYGYPIVVRASSASS